MPFSGAEYTKGETKGDGMRPRRILSLCRPLYAQRAGPKKADLFLQLLEAGMTGRSSTQEQRRPAVARGLFALGLTKAATMAVPRDVEQGGASATPGGVGGPTGGTGEPAAKTPEPLARVLPSRRVQ